MKKRVQISPSEQAEINVSPLIDMVFILLIFFIVATSFVNEIGITTKYKDTSNPVSKITPPLSFELSPSGRVLHNGTAISIEEIAPLVRTADTDSKASISVRVSPGSRAGLATQVVDQAMLGGAKAVKLTPLIR